MEQRIFRTLKTKEYFEFWKQKNISYGTLRHTHRSWLQRAAGDFYVYVYIQIRVVGRTMMDVCMKNFVHGTRMALTDTNTLTGNFYVYMWIQIRVLSCTIMNVIKLYAQN